MPLHASSTLFRRLDHPVVGEDQEQDDQDDDAEDDPDHRVSRVRCMRLD